jgi:hypothetical protein
MYHSIPEAECHLTVGQIFGISPECHVVCILRDESYQCMLNIQCRGLRLMFIFEFDALKIAHLGHF